MEKMKFNSLSVINNHIQTMTSTASIVSSFSALSISADKHDYKKSDSYYFDKNAQNRGDVCDNEGKLICHTPMDIVEMTVPDLLTEDIDINEFKCRPSFELVGARVFYKHDEKKFVAYSNKGAPLFKTTYRDGYSFQNQMNDEMTYLLDQFQKREKTTDEEIKLSDPFGSFCNLFLQKNYIYCFALPTNKYTHQVSCESIGSESLRLVALFDLKTFTQLFTEEKLEFEHNGKKQLLSSIIKVPTYKTFSDIADFAKAVESLPYKNYQGMMIYGKGRVINVFSSDYNDRIAIRRRYQDSAIIALNLIRTSNEEEQKLFESFDCTTLQEVKNRITSSTQKIANFVNTQNANKRPTIIPKTMHFVATDICRDMASRKDTKKITDKDVQTFLYKKYRVRQRHGNIDYFMKTMIYDEISYE